MKPLDLDPISPGIAGKPGVPIIGWLLDGPQPEFTDVVSVARQWMVEGQSVSEVVRAEDFGATPTMGPGCTMLRARAIAGRR